ncbi:MAG TPA: hydroxyquinol 1,2-dioxygenase, partial [Burkholderiales bacterium]
MNAPAEIGLPDKIAGYKTFSLGEFTFARDEYFVTITWPAKGQRMS